MNASVNKVMLLGRVVADLEPVRTLANGSTTTRFRLAVGRGKKDPATGQWVNEDSMYIDCEVFAYPDAKRNLVDIVSRYVKRGDSVFLEGRIRLDEWSDKETGQKRSKHKIDVTDIQFLGGNKADSQDGDQEAPPPRQQAPQQQPRRAPQSAPAGRQTYNQDAPDGDIPFAWALPLGFLVYNLAACVA